MRKTQEPEPEPERDGVGGDTLCSLLQQQPEALMTMWIVDLKHHCCA